jgi:hypothetical protein
MRAPASRRSFERCCPVTLFLHNPANQAHIEDLRGRLSIQLAHVPHLAGKIREDQLLIDHLAGVVRSMDTGVLSPKNALDIFAQHRVPGFSFGKWLIEMVDKGVYLEDLFNEAA